MNIIVIKLSNAEVILAEMVEDDVDYIVVERPLKVIQSPTPTNTPGEYYTLHIPILFNPFGFSTKTTIKKRDIIFYDIADDYYSLYHETCFSSLWNAEIRKQEMVTKLYSGEDENYDDSMLDEESILPEEDHKKTVGELLDDYEEKLKKVLDNDPTTSYNIIDGNETLH